MTRVLLASLITCCFLAVGCAPPAEEPAGVDTTIPSKGGSGGAGKSDLPASTGGKSGSGGATGSGGASASGGGAGGTSSASGGATGTGGGGGEATPDAPVSSGSGGSAGSPDAPTAGAPGGDAGDLVGEPVAGRAHVQLCPKAWKQDQCCEFLCKCLDVKCADSPKDKPLLTGCMAMCMKLSDPRARCQVFHCFESDNPNATKDHDSHCGHASGRVGGGSCTVVMNQK